MPIFEYRCRKCGETTEYIRRVQDREGDLPCDRHGCGGMGEFIIVAPNIHMWEADRAFTNIAPDAKTFPTKASYEQFLKDTHQAEVSTSAPNKTNPASRKIMSFR